MSKKYLLSHFAKKYEVQIQKIESWTSKNLGNIPEYIEAKYNSDIAKFLGVSIRSLKNKSTNNKNKKKSNRSNEFIDYDLQIRINNLSKNIYYELILSEKKNLTKDLYKSENFTIHNKKINEILNKAIKLEDILKKIENSNYKENAEELYSKTYTTLISSLDDKGYLEKIKIVFEKLPDLAEYKENCIKKYFLWSDIIFVKNGFKINPNIAYVFIEIDGPTNILEKVNIKFFEDNYGKIAFKIFINKVTKRVDYTISNDLTNIKDIILSHIESDTITNKPADSKISKFYNTNFSDLNTLHTLKITDIYLFNENRYLSVISKYLKNNDTIIAIWENNKGVFEEALIFIIYRNNFVYFVWENINEKRACYIFKVNIDNKKESLISLKKLINSNIEYKRHNLYNKLNFKSLDIILKGYKVVNHDNIDSFKNRLDKFIV